jgi:hypothetical protein
LIVDTEASIVEHPDGSQDQTFRLGYAIHLRKKENRWIQTGYEIRSIDDFWNLLDNVSREKTRTYVIAHNMAYDYTILKLDTYLSSRQLEIKMRAIDTVFLVRAGNLMLISSTNFYRQSLEKLGEIFGLQKFDKPDFMKTTDEVLMPYCIRDTELLSLIMRQHIDFIHDRDLGCFRPTIAGQAMQTYRHRFMDSRLLVHDNLPILAMEMDSYRGGRCEVFRFGNFENITCLDINSMYPHVMHDMKFPTSLVSGKVLENVEIETLEEALESDYFVMGNLTVDIKEPFLGMRLNDRLTFPIGTVRRTITSPEIEYILANPEVGEIRHINSMVSYHQENIFKNYVDYFYSYRKSCTNKAEEEMVKVLLNSLYGKFGQRNSSDTKMITDSVVKTMYLDMMKVSRTHVILSGINERYVRLGDEVYHITGGDMEPAKDSMPIIASAVTSYARILLYDLMRKAGRENVYYCDTDSLFLNPTGAENLKDLISPTELGKLKIEKFGTVEIRGPKDYTFNGKVKLKGVKKDATRTEDGGYRQLCFETKHTRYRRGTTDGIVHLNPVVKHLSGKYEKGVVNRDGTVSPFMLSES